MSLLNIRNKTSPQEKSHLSFADEKQLIHVILLSGSIYPECKKTVFLTCFGFSVKPNHRSIGNVSIRQATLIGHWFYPLKSDRRKA